ncbi:MAG: helix-turn-helix transcriptional regulator [Thermodesulfobacteriota bacterium]|nr:helix-turn-helix transcriptional regulator [Thermodesulfobacteriota bacterium]
MKDNDSVLSKDFPEKLKKLRKNRGWSQGQLAQRIGADLQRISKYERGVMWPTMELMVRIAKVFEVTVDYLIRNEGNTAIGKIKNQTLLHQIEEVNNLPDEEQQTVISFLDAFIKRKKLEELIHS